MSNDADYELTSSQVPGDGPAGKLLDLLDRHHYRPGHIHLIVRSKSKAYILSPPSDLCAPMQVTADDYKAITTQIFDSETPYLQDDSVFAVKDGLTVKFLPLKEDDKAQFELAYNITMAPLGSKATSNVPLAPEGAF